MSEDRLSQVQRERAEFFATLSRDFRTPLILLLGPLEDLLDSPASALAPASRRVLESARSNARRLLELVDTLPDVAGSDSAGEGASREPIDLAALTAGLADHFRPSCDAGLRLIVDCAPLAVPVAVNPRVWEAIVLNLVAHAFKSTTQGTIAVDLRIHDGHAQLIVSDTGAGIPESDLPYVLNAGHRATTAPPGNRRNRVGLALAADVVRQHQGSIDVRSTPRGTTVTVLMPLAAHRISPSAGDDSSGPDKPVASATHLAAAAEAAPLRAESTDAALASAARMAARSSPRGSVLVAEDHSETREYLCHVLAAAGFTVEAVADGRAALAVCEARTPEAVVSDVLMPGLDGFQLIERLRADERTAVLPVLLLSARGGEDDRIEGIASGADDYLVKPLSSRELVARVDGAVRLARLRRETARRQQADLEALFSMAPDGVIVVGRDGTILTANERAGRLFGYFPQTLLGVPIEALLPAADHRAAHVGQGQTDSAALRQPISPRREIKGVREDGSEFMAEIGFGPLLFRNQACTMAIVSDISERKKTEAERAEHEQRFRHLSNRLLEVQEAERRALSTALHDRTSPQLAAIQINLKMLTKVLGNHDADDVRALLDDTAGLIAETTVGIREISANLRPTVLDDGGLLPALAGYAQQFTQRTGIAVRLQTQDATQDAGAGRAIQSVPHRAGSADQLRQARRGHDRDHPLRPIAATRLSLTVADDGKGFDVDSQITAGLGLLNDARTDRVPRWPLQPRKRSRAGHADPGDHLDERGL